MSRDRVLVLAAGVPIGGIAGELHSRLGIDLATSQGAPGDELLRIDVRPIDLALRAKMALRLVRAFLPFVERPGERLSISHDFENAGIVVASVPGNSDSDERGLSRHSISFRAGPDARTMTDGPVESIRRAGGVS